MKYLPAALVLAALPLLAIAPTPISQVTQCTSCCLEIHPDDMVNLAWDDLTVLSGAESIVYTVPSNEWLTITQFHIISGSYLDLVQNMGGVSTLKISNLGRYPEYINSSQSRLLTYTFDPGIVFEPGSTMRFKNEGTADFILHAEFFGYLWKP